MSDHHGNLDQGPTPTTLSTELGVQGMTCSHCVSSVTQELGRIGGVQHVNVDLVAGGVSRVTVASELPLDAGQIAAAVDEAGYALAYLPR